MLSGMPMATTIAVAVAEVWIDNRRASIAVSAKIRAGKLLQEIWDISPIMGRSKKIIPNPAGTNSQRGTIRGLLGDTVMVL